SRPPSRDLPSAGAGIWKSPDRRPGSTMMCWRRAGCDTGFSRSIRRQETRRNIIMTEPLELRAARPGDELLLLDLIRELAEYEKLAHEVQATTGDLSESLFGGGAVAEAVIAQWQGQAVGFALFFRNFSTF